jgi:hypothetical protein
MQVPCAHFFLTNPTNTPPRQHRLGKTFSSKNLSGSDSDTTYPDFFFTSCPDWSTSERLRDEEFWKNYPCLESR